MALVVRVRFKRASKFYDFDPHGLDLHTGTRVITETARGVELGECMSGVMEVPDERLVLPLKPIIRIATEQDLAIQRRNEQSEKEAFGIALERIADHKLEMKLVDVEYAFDHSKIIFYFTANGRVDFRMLVKNLASIFKTRIELRQIGVRDEAKMLGGIGPCGRPICCRAFLGDFTPVSIKMAKEQNLSLNPTKISGLCDRLMCCLKYEQDQYEATRKRMPRVGREIITPDGVGTINAINVLEETVRVRIAVGDSFELREYPIDDCQRPNQEAQGPSQPQEKAEGAPRRERPERGPKGERAPRQPDGQEQPEQQERPDRPERSDRPERPPRKDRADRGPRADRPPRQARPDRPDRPERTDRGNRPPRRPPRGQEMPAQAPAPVKPEAIPEIAPKEPEAMPKEPQIAPEKPEILTEEVEIRAEQTFEDLL